MVQDDKKTKEDSYHYQRQIKEQNRARIISELNSSPKRFTDLQSITGFSPMGLTKMLKELTREGKIRKEIHNGREAYVLTDRGQRYFSNEVWHIMSALADMKEKGASYVHTAAEAGLGLEFDTIVLNNIGGSTTAINRSANKKTKEQDKDLFSLPFLFSSSNNEQELKEFMVKKVIEYGKEKKIGFHSSSSFLHSKPIEAKAILGISIDYSILTSFLARVQLFMRLISQGRYEDVFSNAELGLNNEDNVVVDSKRRVMLLESYLQYASFFGDAAYEEKLDGFFESMANGLMISKLFHNIDHRVLNKVIADIRKGVYPLKDAEIKDKLAYREGQRGYPFFEYLYAARFVKSKDRDFAKKLDEMMAEQHNRKQLQELSAEYRKVMEHSQIDRMMSGTRKKVSRALNQ